jgi:hypothetical protein
MKKQVVFFLFTLHAVFISAQENNMLLRHDTTLLKADECQWLIKASGIKNESVSQAILEAVESGKLKAFDTQTNELIPGNKIFTWRQPADTTMVWDAKKEENVLKIIQHKINPEYLTRIRIYHDWYLNTATGTMESEIKMIELMGEVRNPSSGDIIGYMPLYRIQY